VALHDLPNYIRDFTALMESYGQQAVYYAHAGAGELHLRPILNMKQREGVALFRNITTDVAKLVKKYRGSFSGEHGDGIVRAEFLRMMVGEKNFELLKTIKKTFDPRNVLNPGKITDAWPMDRSLRYEPGATEPTIETKFDFSDSEGLLRLAEKCNGSGDCRKTEHAHGTMCPSYHATRNEKDTTRARANALREVLSQNGAINKFNSEELREVFDLCIGCKACASECPSNVDMATAKMEFLYQYAKSNRPSLAQQLFAHSSLLTSLGYRAPKLVNFLYEKNFSSKWIKRISGIAPQRRLPKIATKTLRKKGQNTTNEDINIYLFIDEFSKYLDAEIAQDTYDLLTALGYRVAVIDHLDSARALLSKGFLSAAKTKIDRCVTYLHPKISATTPLVGIEPSAILGFRDEFPRLATNALAARQLADNCFLVEEFLSREMAKGNIDRALFTREEKQIKIHVHCHQKALSNQKITFDILNFPENYHPTILPTGCCGMAGSFGYEKAHYEVSMAIGELKLFPSLRKIDKETFVAANGTSCRHQIMDGTGLEAQHPVTILKKALLQGGEG
jgi:Fe-S oxidoreductase